MKILALDVGGTNIKSALIGEDNLPQDVRVTPSGPFGSESWVNNSIAVAKSYSGYDVLSVSMTGQIDDRTQTLLFQYNKEKKDTECPIGALLREAVGCPVFLLNDSNAAALGEACFGAGKDYSDFLCLTYGTGVGGGIIQKRKLFTGNRGIAGEVGHMVIHAGGRLCGCGHRGCYERYASTTALLQAARKVEPQLENARQLFELVPQNPALKRVVRKWVDEIVEGLSTLTYIFNPSCIILGGGVMEREDVLELVRTRYQKRVIPTFSKVDILPAQLGNQAGMFGAVAYARQCMEIK